MIWIVLLEPADASHTVITPDDVWLFNRNASYAWGSDIHLVTHTNAGGGNYLLVMYDADDPQSGSALANLLVYRLDPHLPGGAVAAPDTQYSVSLGELDDHPLAASHRAHVELIFHDNASQVSYLGSGSNWWGGVAFDAWRYGRVIDEYLGYPR